MNNFKNELKNIKDKQQLTIEQMANKANVPFRTLQNWLDETRTPADYVQKLVLNALKDEQDEPMQRQTYPQMYAVCITSANLNNYKNINDAVSDNTEWGKPIHLSCNELDAMNFIKSYVNNSRNINLIYIEKGTYCYEDDEWQFIMGGDLIYVEEI